MHIHTKMNMQGFLEAYEQLNSNIGDGIHSRALLYI